MIAVPLPAPQSPPLPAFDVSAVLDGVTYTLRFQWQTDETGGLLGGDSWEIAVLDEPGQALLMGQFRIVPDWPLYRNRSVRTPPGFLLMRDTSGQGIAFGLSDIGQGARGQLFYLTQAELPAGF
jgi:hypothetical protein